MTRYDGRKAKMSVKKVLRNTTMQLAFALILFLCSSSLIGLSRSPEIIPINPRMANQLIEEHRGNPDFLIVDLRSIEDWKEERLKNAISHLDLVLEQLQTNDEIDRERQYLVYSQSGSPQSELFPLLKEVGILQAYQLTGGITAWKAEGLPTVFFKTITPDAAFALIQKNRKNPNFVIIDLRSEEQWKKQRIRDSVNMDFNQEHFQEELKSLPRDKTYLIHCQIGTRSAETFSFMREFHFEHVYNLKEGIENWIREGLPTIKQATSTI